MSSPPLAADALAHTGLEALRRGDGAGARRAFETLIDRHPEAPRPWFPLAQAYRLTGDRDGETRALEALLVAEPRHLAGLLLMGDRKHADGDDRAASTFYAAAINQAETQPVSPSLRPLLDRAAAFRAQASTRFADHLVAALGDCRSPRVAQSLDLLLGRRDLYPQQPSMFYFEGLPQRSFFARDEFDWAPAVEAAWGAIRDELAALDREGGGFRPYVTGEAGMPRPNNPLLDDPSWGARYLWQRGEMVAETAGRCPATIAALAHAPIPHIAGRSPMALFSRLTPGTHIRPHHGLLNTRLICHLPLVVPEGCGLRVGADERAWREGELLIFDDSIEHEAWNRGGGVRTVLLFEIWRPEIDAAERAELTRLFEAIDLYGTPMVDRG